MDRDKILTEVNALREEGGRYHEQGRHVLSLQCYQKAIPLAEPLGDGGLMAVLLAAAGGEHRDCDNYHHAIKSLVAALVLVPDIEDAIRLRASIKKVLAISFKDVFGPRKADVLQLLEESRADYVYLRQEIPEANVLQHIAAVYVETGRYAEADGMLQVALRKARAGGDDQLISWILNDMAEVEIERDEWGTAMELARQANRRAEAACDSESRADTCITEGRVLMRMNQTRAALVAFEKALTLYTENQNLRRTVRARKWVSQALVSLGRLDEAVTPLEIAIDTATRLDLHHDLAMLYLDLGELELARKNYGLVHQHAARARGLADNDELTELTDAADYLLHRCRDQERSYG